MTDPIKILDFFTRVKRIKWEKIPRNSVWGKIFWEWMERTDELPAGYEFKSISLLFNSPIPYDIQNSNWADCADWLKENFVTADTRFPLKCIDKFKTNDMVIA